MIPANETRISAPSVRSLMWEGDTLIDWAGGGVRYGAEGEITRFYSSFGPHFDHAVSSPSGQYAVIYAGLGTKGLLTRNDEMQREINRSYYHADAYEFPLALVRLKKGCSKTRGGQLAAQKSRILLHQQCYQHRPRAGGGATSRDPYCIC